MNAATMTASAADGVGRVRATYEACVEQVEKLVIGQRRVLDGAFVALLTDGHVLLEGVPGLAKTMLIRTLAAALDCRFSRIQFTPDLMPSDVTGSTILRDGELVFRPGPVFTHLLLGDEINRAPAKTQSAMLESMQERAVTADGVRHELEGMFTVFATQNPIEQEGTYPLPEAELDRFMMMLRVGYPDEAAERRIMAAHHARSGATGTIDGVEPVAGVADLAALKQTVRAVEVAEEVLDYATRLTRATRSHLSVAVGASPRAGIHLLRAAKASAAIAGREFTIPDDVKGWAQDVLRHRLVLMPGAEIAGTTTDDVVASLLDTVDVPT